MARQSWDGELVRRVLDDTRRSVKTEQVPFLAAGLAYYGFLALIPGLIAVVSIFGLIADAGTVQSIVDEISDTAPAEVSAFLESQLTSIVDAPSAGLGLGAGVSLVGALWVASTGTQALIRGVNLAHGIDETRGPVKLRALALALTVATMAGVVALLAGVTILPGAIGGGVLGGLIDVARWILLFAAAVAGLAALYRFAPARRPPAWSLASAGAVVAAVAWLVASYGLGIYTSRFASYNETYGTLGAVVVVLIWLFVSGFAVLLGAVVDAAIQRARTGPPATG